MVRVAICEDDLFYMEREKNLIESYLQTREIRSEITTFSSSIELTKAYANSFDIIFLDVEMDEMNGMEVAHWLRDKGAKSHIIFLSAYAEYLPDGYKVDAHRYLLKNDAKFDESFINELDKFEYLMISISSEIMQYKSGWSESELKSFSAMSLLNKLDPASKTTRGVPQIIWDAFYSLLKPQSIRKGDTREVELLNIAETGNVPVQYMIS